MAEYNRLNRMEYSRLLMVVVNGPEGKTSPAISSALAFSPVLPSECVDGRSVLLTLDEEYGVSRSFRVFDFDVRVRNVIMTPDERGDPAQTIQDARQIKMSLKANQAVAPSLLAYTLYRAPPNEHGNTFRTIDTQKVHDGKELDIKDKVFSLLEFPRTRQKKPAREARSKRVRALVIGIRFFCRTTKADG